MGEEETKRADQEKESAVAPTEFSEESVSPSKKDAADHEVGRTMGKLINDRGDEVARVEMEKRLGLIKAWEDNEKAVADNKAFKSLCAIDTWEITKRASTEAQLKQIEEEIEKKKAEERERMKTKMAIIHKEAEEKRALIESDRGKDFLAVEEAASKFRATGGLPKKLFACFSCSFFL